LLLKATRDYPVTRSGSIRIARVGAFEETARSAVWRSRAPPASRVDLGFPEFIRHIRTLDSKLAIALLKRYPTVAAVRTVSVRRLAQFCYDGSHNVGE
jgi:hypothetical protein